MHFGLDGDVVGTRIEHMSELGEGVTFQPSGVQTSGPYKVQPYRDVYSVETRNTVFLVSGGC